MEETEKKKFREKWKELPLSDKAQIILLCIMGLTLITTIITLNLQNNQYLIDNRPSVFIPGWKDNTLKIDNENMDMSFAFSLFNVGKLPAKLHNPTYKIKDGNNIIYTGTISNEVFIFPEQDNIILSFIIPHQEIYELVTNKGFNLEVSFSYYSLNDKKMKKKYYYLLDYNFPVSPNYPNRLNTPHLNRIYAE